VFVVCTVAMETVLGIGIANLLNRPGRLSAIGRGVVLLPMMLSPMATGITWRAMFFQQQFGLINYVLGLAGISGPGWLGDPSWSLITVMILDVWLATPFMTLFMLAGLQSIPQSQIESAQLDGANRFQINVRIILPMMKDIVMVAIVLRTIFNLRVFETIYALTRGGPGLSSTTLGILAYREAFTYWRIGNSGAMATILFLISLALCVLYIRLIRRERRTPAGGRR
jgi:multiple sugar transport system permease protein